MSRITLRVGLSRATRLSISSLGHRSLITASVSYFHLLWASVKLMNHFVVSSALLHIQYANPIPQPVAAGER
jgi:hypothetical protein